MRVGNYNHPGRENSIKIENISTIEDVRGTEGKRKCKKFPRVLIITVSGLEILLSGICH